MTVILTKRVTFTEDAAGLLYDPSANEGGDCQQGGSWSRRWTGRAPEGLWAVIEQAFYASVRPGYEVESGEDPEPFFPACTTTYMLCRDPEDVGGTEVWTTIEHDTDLSAFNYDTVTKAEAVARAHAEDADPAHFHWHGVPVPGR